MSKFSAKVYMKPGGDEMVVGDGGKISIEPGGTIEVNGVALSADNLEAFGAIPDSDPEDEGVIWNDGGTLKASAGVGG